MHTIAVYTITSGLHDAAAVKGLSDAFLQEIFPSGGYDLCGADFADFGQRPLNLIYVRTGGAEGIFKTLLPGLLETGCEKFFLLTSGKSNSLAASLEILSYLQLQGLSGEVLHGSGAALQVRIGRLARVAESRRKLRDSRIALIGQPSDWLIASTVDREAVSRRLGVGFADIPIDALVEAAQRQPVALPDTPLPENVRPFYPGALQIYGALKEMVGEYGIGALTLRCFDLLTRVRNTGCVALARLNAEGVPASCEGDVPALLSMMMARALTGCTGFQANPSRIDTESGELLFAHCTIALDIPTDIAYDTHFESGIGVGLHGEFPLGPVTVFKVSGDLTRCFIAEGEVLRNSYEDNLCRTQVCVRLSPADARYFLTRPIGNHHILLPGRHKDLLEEFIQSI